MAHLTAKQRKRLIRLFDVCDREGEIIGYFFTHLVVMQLIHVNIKYKFEEYRQ
uniref:Uncharacterized protein n=1 Tax=Anguilla anguilla TaxID=7936 RepID=A0A0E9TF74_ANGAN